MEFRTDKGTLGKPVRLSNGRVIVSANISRSGVFHYVRADGSVSREYRPPSEVFSPESMKSFQLVPVTDNHPPGGVNSMNAAQLAVGTTGENVHRNDKLLTCPIALNDEHTIAQAYAGKVELSCGYHSVIVPSPGVSPEGEPYDVIQTKIRGDHVALVDRGRAGSEVRLRMDGHQKQEPLTPQIQDHNMSAELHQKISQLTITGSLDKSRADAAELSLKNSEARADKAEADKDTLQAKVDSLEAEAAAQVKRSDAEISELVSLRSDALVVLSKEFKCDGKTSREIKEAIVAKVTGKAFPENKADGYVDARFDSCMESFNEKTSNSDKEIYKDMTKVVRSDSDLSGQSLEAKSRQDMIDRREKRAEDQA